jgi:hypothetical protein
MNAKRLDEIAALQEDHARLARLLDDVEKLCRRRAFLSAARLFVQYRSLQEHHLLREEEALDGLQASAGLTAIVVDHIAADHREIRSAIERVAAAIGASEWSRVEREMPQLLDRVRAHEEHEEEELLPVLRRLVGGRAAARAEQTELTR